MLTAKLGKVMLGYKTRRILFNINGIRDLRLANKDFLGLIRYLEELQLITNDLNRKAFIIDWIGEIRSRIIQNKH